MNVVDKTKKSFIVVHFANYTVCGLRDKTDDPRTDNDLSARLYITYFY